LKSRHPIPEAGGDKTARILHSDTADRSKRKGKKRTLNQKKELSIQRDQSGLRAKGRYSTSQGGLDMSRRRFEEVPGGKERNENASGSQTRPFAALYPNICESASGGSAGATETSGRLDSELKPVGICLHPFSLRRSTKSSRKISAE